MILNVFCVLNFYAYEDSTKKHSKRENGIRLTSCELYEASAHVKVEDADRSHCHKSFHSIRSRQKINTPCKIVELDFYFNIQCVIISEYYAGSF